MIDRSVEGRVLRTSETPDMRVLARVTSICACEVYVGFRLDLDEPAVAWSACEAHIGQGGPRDRFAQSLTENPSERPVEDVIEEMLREANIGRS